MAGTVSLALHGGLLLAIGAGDPRIPRAPRLVEPVMIEVIAPVAQPPAQPALPVAPAVHAASTPAPVHGRRGQSAPQRAPAPPASVRSALPDLKVSYDSPSNFAASADAPGDGDGPRGSGRSAGIAKLDGDLAVLAVPAPPASLARSPRPRRDYHQLRLHSVRQYAGRSIRVVLSIDERGRVRDVRLVQGVNADLDQRTIALTRAFEFEPALDETGAPVPGVSRWEIAIVDDSNPGLRGALKRGYY